MKRSLVNEIITEADKFIASHGYILPPFAYFNPEQMRSIQARNLRERGLGWDITDYGKGRFDELGLFLFTTRNGIPRDLKKGKGMLYAEKIIISRKNQLSPMHRHIIKAEDIINRGGGDLVIELFASGENGEIDRKSDIIVTCDGMDMKVQAGGRLRLRAGQSVTLMPGVWHAFWAEGKDCLIGEVSTVNDDKTDNVFEMKIGRFSKIEEDVAPKHLLVSDY